MNGRLRLGLLALVTLCLAAFPLQPKAVSGQEASARFRVLIPEIQPTDDSDDKFGERLADQLRELVNDMTTHQPIEEKELKNALKQYDVDMEDLDCVAAKQLGGLINAQVVFCGTYRSEGDGYRVETKFFSSSGDEFPVDPITVPEKGQREAAEHIYQALQVQSDQDRASQFCGDYATSQQWEDALDQCTRAIELNPRSVNSRYTLGVVYRQTDRMEEALEQFQQVIELDPVNEAAMQNAGYVAATLGLDSEAREYYEQYLTLNPGNAGVRMNVAYELAKAGDPLGAMQFIDVGLEVDPENVELLRQHGNYAFAAGAEMAQGQEELPPEAAELYRKALDSYEKVYAAEGEAMPVDQLRRMVVAHIQLGQAQDAVDMAERILETHGQEPTIWSIYADALKADGQLDEAIAALDKVKELDPSYANVAARQGNWLVQEGRIEDAIPILQEAVDRGEQSADAIANVLYNNAVTEGIQKDNWAHAIETLRLTREFDVTDMLRQQFDFYLGYAIFNSAIAQQAPNTLETAKASLPRFQEVVRLMQACADYAQRNNREGNRQQILTATATYIDIQEAIIKRGR